MIRLSLIVFFVSMCLMLTGCPNNPEPPKPAEPDPVPVAQMPVSAPSDETSEKPNASEFNLHPDYAINYDDGFHSHGRGRFGGLLAILGNHQFHVEFLPNAETGDITAILYDDHFKPFNSETKELTVSLMIDGEPKQFTFLVNFEGSKEKPALYKISDTTLAKLLHDGWTGNALVSITIDDKPANGRLIPVKR